MKFIRLFLLCLLCTLFADMAFAQAVLDTTTNTITLPPITFPKDGGVQWLYTKEGQSALLGLFGVITYYISNVFPAFRKIKLDAPLKAIIVGIGVTVIFATVKGMPLFPTLLSFVFTSVPFWSQAIYSFAAKPLLGSSNDVVAAVSKSGADDPNVPYDGVTENTTGEAKVIEKKN